MVHFPIPTGKTPIWLAHPFNEGLWSASQTDCSLLGLKPLHKKTRQLTWRPDEDFQLYNVFSSFRSAKDSVKLDKSFGLMVNAMVSSGHAEYLDRCAENAWLIFSVKLWGAAVFRSIAHHAASTLEPQNGYALRIHFCQRKAATS